MKDIDEKLESTAKDAIEETAAEGTKVLGNGPEEEAVKPVSFSAMFR